MKSIHKELVINQAVHSNKGILRDTFLDIRKKLGVHCCTNINSFIWPITRDTNRNFNRDSR